MSSLHPPLSSLTFLTLSYPPLPSLTPPYPPLHPLTLPYPQAAAGESLVKLTLHLDGPLLVLPCPDDPATAVLLQVADTDIV